MNFQVRFTTYQDKKLKTCREHDLELAANRAEPDSQAELVLGTNPDKIKVFQKIISATMPVHHVKGQPAASTYVGEKGCVKKDSNRDTPCILYFKSY